jgi:hypothetical protein
MVSFCGPRLDHRIHADALSPVFHHLRLSLCEAMTAALR